MKDTKQYLALCLTLFATQTTLLDDTGNDLSPEMKTYYSMELLEDAKPNLVHDQFGQKRPIPKNGGKTIEWRKFSSLPAATTPLTEGVTPAGNKLNVSALTATVNQYGDYITQSDVLELTAIDNTVLEATKILGAQAGVTLDTVIRNVLVAGTNVIYAPKVVTDKVTEVTSRAALAADSLISVDLVYKAVRKLKSMNVPTIGGKYIAIIHPDVAHDLMRSEEWKEAHKYASPEQIYNGEIGELAGVRFVESTQSKIWNDSSAESGATPAGLAVYGCLFFGADAYGVVDITGGGLEHIVKQKGSAGTADPLNQRSSVGWKAMQTAVILDQTRIVRVECTSSFSASATAN